MRSINKTVDDMNINIKEFSSLQDVVSFIKNTPDTNWLRGSSRTRGDRKWAGTDTFEEALDLMKNGWTDKSKELEDKLNKKLNKEAAQVIRQKSVYDVVGGNCSVPRYLQGVPTSMIRQVRTPVKQKVVTVNYSIGFNANVTGQQITDWAVDCLSYVKHLEDTGVRVNLNVIWVSYKYSDYVSYLIPVKKSSERMSIAKMAFCLCNPAMLRRIGFALLEKDEVLPKLKFGEEFKWGYGKSTADKQILSKIYPDMEIYNAK